MTQPDATHPFEVGTRPRHELVATINHGTKDPDDIAREVMRERSGPKPLPTHDWAELSRPRPRIPWLVPAVQLAPGRPTLWTAPAGSGKTWLAMSLALAIGAGLSTWLSIFPVVRSGPVVHINLEMHGDELARRYQRLARGMGVDVAQVRVVNRADVPPGFSLTHRDAAFVVETLVATVTGAVLCVIDSFRAFIGNVDENKSEVRIPLDLLLSVSERTGCAFVVIHHEGKPSKDGEKASVQNRARGSSAIVDACDCTFSFTPSKIPSGIDIEQGKASMGRPSEAFTARLVDVGDLDEDGRSAAIRVEYVPPEEAGVLAEYEAPHVRRAREAILEALRIHGSLYVRQIMKGSASPGVPFVKGKYSAKAEALELLEADGLVVATFGKNRTKGYSLP